MAVILELDSACGPQTDGAFAGVVITQEFISRPEVAGLVLPVVKVSCDNHLIAKGQQLAPSAFQILRRGGVRQIGRSSDSAI